MSKIVPNKPVLVMLYGFPGSGKSHFAGQLCNFLQAAHVSGDKIRHQLFENPRYDKAENEIVDHLMEYMTEEFLDAGVSVVFDTNVTRRARRRYIRELARKAHAKPILAWLQIDPDSAFARVSQRDRRRNEDKYAMPLDKPKFNEVIGDMQNPDKDEDFIVLSGKHSFPMQRSSLLKRMYDLNLLSADMLTSNVVKPGMVNLIPDAGRVDMTRRNITIR
jgi:predicted kinase